MSKKQSEQTTDFSFMLDSKGEPIKKLSDLSIYDSVKPLIDRYNQLGKRIPSCKPDLKKAAFYMDYYKAQQKILLKEMERLLSFYKYDEEFGPDCGDFERPRIFANGWRAVCYWFNPHDCTAYYYYEGGDD